MATTFTLIKTVTVGSGGTTSIDFTSIPATFTDLCLKWSLRASTAVVNTNLNFNSNTTGYSGRQLYGTGAAVASNIISSYVSNSGLADSSGDTASTFSNCEIYIPNYAGSNYKSFSIDSVTENNATTAYAAFLAGLWSNTAAITSISISGLTFVQYSSASLYGILKA
jgi:hypothetical protein